MRRKNIFGATLLALLFSIAIIASLSSVSAYTPQKGDYFNYSQTISVNNGQGSYVGYTDQSLISGMEQMNGVNRSVISTSYLYSFQYSNNQGSSTSSSLSGSYTWSSKNFTYIKGTDNQLGYSKPIYVWFSMDTSIPEGGTFYILNTKFTVLSKNYSFQLPTENKYVQSIKAEGSGQYQRNDSYGLFTASYTWDAYFDPSTGYIIGYNYVEQDNGQYQGQAGSFTYTDDLYVTLTSYVLALGSAPPNGNVTTGLPPIFNITSTNFTGYTNYSAFDPFFGFIIVGSVIILFIIAIAIYAATRRKRGDSLPKHPYTPYTPPPNPSTSPWESKIDLGSKPPEQVVIRDVAKVNCKYCGTLIPATADTCPYCGAPRQ